MPNIELLGTTNDLGTKWGEIHATPPGVGNSSGELLML